MSGCSPGPLCSVLTCDLWKNKQVFENKNQTQGNPEFGCWRWILPSQRRTSPSLSLLWCPSLQVPPPPPQFRFDPFVSCNPKAFLQHATGGKCWKRYGSAKEIHMNKRGTSQRNVKREAEGTSHLLFCLGTKTWNEYFSHLHGNVPERAQSHELPRRLPRLDRRSRYHEVPRLPSRWSGDTQLQYGAPQTYWCGSFPSPTS